MINKVKKFFRINIVNRIYKKIFSFYNSLETISPQELHIEKSDKILILAPHPDDEVIGCGGLLLKYPSQCEVVCLTDGRYGDENIEPLEMVNIRKKEFKNVMQKLGVKDFYFLDIEDTKLKYHYNKFKKINFKNYNYIFIPNYLDQHPDHKAVLKLLIKAYKENLVNKNVRIAMYEVWGTLPLPNYYIDLTNLVDEKRNIINLYYSQIKHIDYAKKILALNEYRGMIANKNSIETYFVTKIGNLLEV